MALKWSFFAVLLLAPLWCCAQEEESADLDRYVEEVNSLCPIDYGDDWGIGSMTMVGDRYALVDVLLPANMSMVLSSFSGKSRNVRRLWVRQLEQYGERWNRFVELMIEADRRIIISLRPKGSSDTAFVYLSPVDFANQ